MVDVVVLNDVVAGVGLAAFVQTAHLLNHNRPVESGIGGDHAHRLFQGAGQNAGAPVAASASSRLTLSRAETELIRATPPPGTTPLLYRSASGAQSVFYAGLAVLEFGSRWQRPRAGWQHRQPAWPGALAVSRGHSRWCWHRSRLGSLQSCPGSPRSPRGRRRSSWRPFVLMTLSA